MNFVLQERLKWMDLKPRSKVPFSDLGMVDLQVRFIPYALLK